jgi:hypothetical protein
MAKYFITKTAGRKFWLDNETYGTPYRTFVVIDNSNYDGYYGPGEVLNILGPKPIFIAYMVYEWMVSDDRTEEERKAAEQFLAPVKHLFEA